jgi:hypothetical protein
MKQALLAPLAALLLTTGAAAQTPGPGDAGTPATIPFVGLDNIQDFDAAPNGKGIYLKDRRRNWYYADLIGPCINLSFATRIAVATGAYPTLDSTGAIIVDGERCTFSSLVHSGPPPKKVKKPK